MYVRIVLWELDGAGATIEELRDYLAAESVQAFEQVEGLVLKQWVADPATNRWGAIYLWESEAASHQTLPSKARQLIGKDPDQVLTFNLEASATGITNVSSLTRLGAAFS